jgi:hypothetical protein
MNKPDIELDDTVAGELKRAAAELQKAKRMTLAKLTNDPNPEHLWEVLVGAARFIDAFDSEGEAAFASWLLYSVRPDPIHFVLQLFAWITDSLASSAAGEECLTNREHAELFLREKDRILLSLYRRA